VSSPASAQRACSLLAAALAEDTVQTGDPSPSSVSNTSVCGLDALAKLATSLSRLRCSLSGVSFSASLLARLRCAALTRIDGWRD